MNKVVFFMLVLITASILSAKTFDESDYRIYNSKNGSQLDLQQMAKQLSDYDVIFFGEWHDDVLLHQLEADILPLLKSKKIAISMEMFERDTQNILDDFLADKITESQFIKQSRAWGNYLTDYKKIVDFAKKKNFDVIAANVPRRYASMVNKQSPESLKTLPADEKQYVAKELKALDNQYKKQFMETMAANMGRKNAMGMHKMMENIYAAQCLKDDTMAESIFEYLQQNKKTQVIHYNGNFHSESHLGTANKLRLLNPKLKIAVITPVVIGDDESLRYNSDNKSLGDFLIFAKRFPQEDEKEFQKPKMFNVLSNTILEHKLNLEIIPSKKILQGYDEITLSKQISKKDTIYLLSAYDIKNVSINDKKIDYQIIEKEEEYQGIIFSKDYDSNNLKIEYGGKVYFPLKGRELNQTHDGTMGIISDANDEGIYLPGANWYPIMSKGLADFDITISCPNDFKLLTSGKESKKKEGKSTIYNWKTELSVSHISLVGNKFELTTRVVDGVEIRTYLLLEDAKFAETYLDGLEKYLKDYSKLFGEYPFSSFSVVENFFTSGFGMPNYTLLTKEIVKMPFITLSPGVIAHEFCHNWWGNSVYVDYDEGNWCEALTVFSSNYYQNILNDKPDKAKDWRKKAILENNLLPAEKNFPLKEFVYQHNNDEAVIGYQKGAMLFVNLYQLLGEELFFEVIKDFYKTNKGKVASWNDIRNSFAKHYSGEGKLSLDAIFEFWLYSTELPHILFDEVSFEDNKLTYSLINETAIPLQIPIKISLKDGSEISDKITILENKAVKSIELKNKPTKIEIDPDGFILKKISDQSMPYNLNRTLNDKPLVILPEKGEMVSRLQMVASMFARSGYEIQTKLSNEVTEEDLKNNTLFIMGEISNNSILSQMNLPQSIKISENIIEVDGKKITSSKGSIIISFGSNYNVDKSISIYAWNSSDAIASFRKMFHYMNDSWQTFDLEIKEKGTLNSGQIFPLGKNELVFDFE
ncbi:MAG: ChaN family lipoprotein [Candidatus Cloacimonadota bacterium]|nr:ChaN family lipoprotein [Candidatus Cloacimonadota bacterium]